MTGRQGLASWHRGIVEGGIPGSAFAAPPCSQTTKGRVIVNGLAMAQGNRGGDQLCHPGMAPQFLSHSHLRTKMN